MSGSTFHEFAEHLLGIDGDEDAFAARQDFAFLVEDFGGVDVLAAVHADLPTFDPQRLLQRNGLQIFDRHFFCDRNHVAKLVGFAHSVVEDGGNDAAMAVAGRSGVALRQAEMADEGAPLFVERELQMHAIGIIGSAGEAVVRGKLDVAGFVTVDLAGHGTIKP